MKIKSRRFTFGKYKGKEVLEIICTHTGYILWLLQNTQFKLYDLEQEVYDAVAKGKMEGPTKYIYNKEELGQYIKNKNIATPFVDLGIGSIIKKELADTKLCKIIGYYLNNSEYTMPMEVTHREKQSIYDSMLKINSYMFEDDYYECDDCSSMSSFLY